MTHLTGWAFLAAVQSLMPDTVTLQGTIVAAGTDRPLPFSIVEISPGPAQRFTDGDGAFSFYRLPSGTYRVRVRQIGYRPRDTTVTLRGDDAPLRISLLRLAVRLPAMTVTGTTTCVTPGPPDPALNPELAVVFDQLLENARRHVLLADSYPHRYQTQRTFTSVVGRRRNGVATVDTMMHESWVRWAYVPGHVVGPPDRNNDRLVRLMTLPDFADSAFVTHHCFWLAGRDTLEGDGYIRVDFAPGPAVRTPDVAGAAYLDSLTYQLAFTNVRLTRPEQVERGVRSLEAISHFSEVLPGIPIRDRVRSVQEYGLARRTLPADALRRVEEQQLLSVDFLRPVVPNQ